MKRLAFSCFLFNFPCDLPLLYNNREIQRSSVVWFLPNYTTPESPRHMCTSEIKGNQRVPGWCVKYSPPTLSYPSLPLPPKETPFFTTMKNSTDRSTPRIPRAIMLCPLNINLLHRRHIPRREQRETTRTRPRNTPFQNTIHIQEKCNLFMCRIRKYLKLRRIRFEQELCNRGMGRS